MKIGSPGMLRLPHTPHNRRAMDGEEELAGASGMGGMEPVAGMRAARSVSLAVARVVVGGPLCQRSPHGHHLAACRGDQCRLLRLLLLPRQPRWQYRIGRYAIGPAAVSCVAAARPVARRDRRFADQAL